MKKSFIKSLTLLLAMGAFQAFGQVVSLASHPDLPITTSTAFNFPPQNSAICVAPNSSALLVHNVKGVAFDDAIGSDIQVSFIEGNLGPGAPTITPPIITTFILKGNDPDMEFFANPDLAGVIYHESTSGNITLNTYFLNTMPIKHYALSSSLPIAPGTYPNIDLSSSSAGEGVLCYEDGGNIMLGSFTIGHPNTNVGPILNIGAGRQPDVVITDHINRKRVIVTFIQNQTWVTRTYDYNQLVSGIPNMLATNSVTAAPGETFDFPRIACNKSSAANQSSNLTFDDYAVVAEHNMPGVTEIIGRIFPNGAGGGGWIQVNNGIQTCDNARPVLTYTNDHVIFQWSADYAACVPPVVAPNFIHTDVLMKRYDANSSTEINPGMFNEVNRSQAPFFQSNTSIATQKDGVYGTQDLEATFYSDNDGVFYKERLYAGVYSTPEKTNDKYNYYGEASNGGETLEPGALSLDRELQDNSITLLGNPVESKAVIQVNGIENVAVKLRTIQGQEVMLEGRMVRNGNQITIDMSDLAKGTYYLNCMHSSGDKTFNLQLN